MYKKTKGYAKKRMNKGGTVKMARMMNKGGTVKKRMMNKGGTVKKRK